MFINELADTKSVILVGPLCEKKIKNTGLPVISVDGGTAFVESIPKEFLLSVGDGDSYLGNLDHVLPANKDYSDLAFALSLLPETIENINCIGFLGGRRDHELINLGEIYHSLKSRLKCAKVSIDDKITMLPAGRHTLFLSGLFTIATLATGEITIQGACKYKLESKTPIAPLSSLGLSNIGSGKVDIECTVPILVFILV